MQPKYTQEQLGRFRKALLGLLQDGPHNAEYGVCYNLNTSIRSAHADASWFSGYDFVAEEAVDWPHAIKNEAGTLHEYFVPSKVRQGLWEGDNLKMRQNLIQYLLGRVAHHEAMLRGGVALAG